MRVVALVFLTPRLTHTRTPLFDFARIKLMLPITRSTALLSAISLSSFIPAPSVAQEPLQEVVVFGAWKDEDGSAKRNAITQRATGLPSGIAVITREELSTINIGRDVSNMFRRVPGVVANSLDQGETGNGFRMRGFATQGTHGADTAVYADNVPQNVPSSEAGAGHGPAFLEWLSPTIVERVEVIKGPISALHGDQNRSGAVNIWTVQGEVPSQVGLTVESFDGRRGAMLLSQEFGRLTSVLAADVYRTDTHRRRTWTDRDNVFWTVAADVDDARYSLRLNHYDAEFEAAGYVRYDRLSSGHVSREAPEENALPPFGRGERTAIAFNRAPLDSELGFYATAYAENFERVRAAAGGGVVHNIGADDRKIYGGRALYRFGLGTRAAIDVGVDGRRDDGTGIRQRFENRQPTPSYLTYLDMDLLTYGVFSQAQYQPIDAAKLHVGVRNDWFDYDIDNVKLPGASANYRDSVVTPKIGAVWSATPYLDVFANIAQGFRSPAAQQISPSGSVGPLNAAGGTINDEISPSKVESYDIGFVIAPRCGWTATATYFYTLNEDEIVQTGANVFASAGATTREGVEVDARFQLTAMFAAYASYTRLVKASIDDAAPATASLISVPKHQGKMGAEFVHRIGGGSLRYNVDAYSTRGIPYFTGTPLQQREVPSYVRYDVRTSFDIDAFQVAAYAILQPHLISESFFANAAGLWVSTQPREHYGLSLRYSF